MLTLMSLGRFTCSFWLCFCIPILPPSGWCVCLSSSCFHSRCKASHCYTAAKIKQYEDSIQEMPTFQVKVQHQPCVWLFTCSLAQWPQIILVASSMGWSWSSSWHTSQGYARPQQGNLRVWAQSFHLLLHVLLRAPTYIRHVKWDNSAHWGWYLNQRWLCL